MENWWRIGRRCQSRQNYGCQRIHFSCGVGLSHTAQLFLRLLMHTLFVGRDWEVDLCKEFDCHQLWIQIG